MAKNDTVVTTGKVDKDERVQFERLVPVEGGRTEKKIFTYRREIAERLAGKGLGRIVTVEVKEVKKNEPEIVSGKVEQGANKNDFDQDSGKRKRKPKNEPVESDITSVL